MESNVAVNTWMMLMGVLVTAGRWLFWFPIKYSVLLFWTILKFSWTALKWTLVVLAPPVNVAVNRGTVGQILVSILLTFCLYVPGVIYAFKVRSDNHRRLRDAEKLLDRLTAG